MGMSYEYSRTPIIRTSIIRIIDYPDRLVGLDENIISRLFVVLVKADFPHSEHHSSDAEHVLVLQLTGWSQHHVYKDSVILGAEVCLVPVLLPMGMEK